MLHNDNQYEFFLSEENLYVAFKRLCTASRDTYKEWYFEDIKIFGLCLEENIKTLLNDIKQEIYVPESSYKVFIPKKNNLVRPLSLLKFRDLLVYQSIANVIADTVYNEVKPYYNNFVFGNVFNTTQENKKDRIFFFKPWKQQWKAFGEKATEYYSNNYIFVAEFDIASFFDTIDHFILQQILELNYNIDENICRLLTNLLEAFTKDSSHKTFNSKHGIPQGPIASQFLADLYLFHVDREMINSSLDIKYIRYVDDIRIYSRDEFTAKKAIAYLDLLARDLGLIPQVNKICIDRINSIEEAIGREKNKFSLVTKEYKKNGRLNSKTQKNLKKKFLECFDKNPLNGNYLNKTTIKFSLYKLNKDEDVKNILLTKKDDLYIHFEEILFYLKKYFSEDNEVGEWLIQILKDENVLFKYIIGLIFKFFPEIEFTEDAYRKYLNTTNRHWIVKYYMIAWIYANNKHQIFTNSSQDISDNYFINREIFNYKCMIATDEICRNILARDMMKSKDCMVAMHGFYLHPILPRTSDDDFAQYNSYIQSLVSGKPTNYINHILKDKLNILESESFFNLLFWNNELSYEELNISFRYFFEYKNIDPSKSLLNLNNFNNLVHDKICELLQIELPSKEYGSNLNSELISSNLPFTSQYFMQINSNRNQRTDAHSYDRRGDIRLRITSNELDNLIDKEKISLKEICVFFNNHST